MSVEAEYAIKDHLRESEEPMTFSELKEVVGVQGQDLRRGLRELLTNGTVYVTGVEDREKQYDIR